MDNERKLITESLREEKTSIMLKAWYKLPTKLSKESIAVRKQGNNLFNQKNIHNAQVHEQIWKLYSQSVAKAPNGSEELALAYGNRSALLLHLNKFEESIKDIERALCITKSNALQVKLILRKEECLAGLSKTESLAEKADLTNGFSVKLSMQNSLNSREEDDKKKAQQILLEYETMDHFNKVVLKHNEKYGRHLVAKRDIKPGEIIMVERPHFKCVNLNNSHAFCSHCLATTWASIPCDFCTWCMFCSEKCKIEAWKKYHNFECSVIPYIMFNEPSDYWKQLSLRLILAAIKESGSIQNLKNELEKIDTCQSILNRGFINRKFCSDKFQSIYSLSSDVSSEDSERHTDHAVLTLIILAKSTSLFGENIEFNTVNDFVSNEDIIFVGSLLLKLIKISDINAHCVMEGSSKCRFFNDTTECYKNRCCEKGVCLAALPSMFNHSCYPNVRKCFTETMQLVVYALKPIETNSQLFDSYIGYFFDKPKIERQLLLEEYFNFTCECPPCLNNWPAISLTKDRTTSEEKNYEIEIQLREEYKELIKSTNSEHSQYTLDSIEYLSEGIEKSMKQCTQPSRVTVSLISTLWTIFDTIYGMKLQVENECRL